MMQEFPVTHRALRKKMGWFALLKTVLAAHRKKIQSEG
jgi:hypothetical protein